jgi:hypothetical protein
MKTFADPDRPRKIEWYPWARAVNGTKVTSASNLPFPNAIYVNAQTRGFARHAHQGLGARVRPPVRAVFKISIDVACKEVEQFRSGGYVGSSAPYKISLRTRHEGTRESALRAARRLYAKARQMLGEIREGGPR